MAVIKCSNCENEIMDTEIVCPYCGNPVVGQRLASASASAEDDALSGATVKIPGGKENVRAKEELSNKDYEEWAEFSDVKQETSKFEMRSEKSNIERNAKKEPGITEKTGGSNGRDAMDATRKYARSTDTRTSSRNDHSRKSSRTRKKKKKEGKWVVLGITLVGIVVIIFLVINVFSRIFGEGLFEPEKESKKAKDFVESSAEELDLGFEFNSHTLTITDESIISVNYEANSEKPWKDHVSEITNLTIANGIEIIGAHAFDDIYGLKHVTLATTVSNIGSSAFYGCTDLEEVVVDSEKSKLKSIGDNAFTDCASLKRVTFGNQLKRIGAGAFKSCDSLTRVEIPDTTTEIGEEAFLGCPDLVIVCSEGSYAHTYAMENGIAVELTEADGDETVTTTSGYTDASFGTGTATPSQNNNKQNTNKEDKKKEDSDKKDKEDKEDKKDKEDKEDKDNKEDNKEDKDTATNEPNNEDDSTTTTPVNGNGGTTNPTDGAVPARDVNTQITNQHQTPTSSPVTESIPVGGNVPTAGGTSGSGNNVSVEQQLAELQSALGQAKTPEEREAIADRIARMTP